MRSPFAHSDAAALSPATIEAAEVNPELKDEYVRVHTAELGDPCSASRATGPARLLGTGWKGAVALGLAATVVVGIINLGILIWAAAGKHGPASEGVTNVYTGSCSTVAATSIWTHLAINCLSTLLLAASNHAMQVLAAPTRAEIDRAHARRISLDVGVHTLRNFGQLPAVRRWLWVLLALTSVPLHLLYNSVIVEAQLANNYAVVTADQAFLGGASWNSSRSICFETDPVSANPAIEFLQENQSLVRLENAECINAYSPGLINNYGNVLLVTNAQENPQGWICKEITGPGKICDFTQEVANADSWQMPGTTSPGIHVDPWEFDGNLADLQPRQCYISMDTWYDVEYCLAQPTPGNCSVGVVVPILAVVVVCNVVKALCLYWAWRRVHFTPLLTVGDAAASFLERNDPTTVGYGAIEAGSSAWKDGRPAPKPWSGASRFGFQSAGAARWIISSIFFLGFWALCMGLLELGLQSYVSTRLSTSISSLADDGIGQLNLQAIVPGVLDALQVQQINIAVLLANLPQLLLSLLYFLYNDLITRMHLSREWTSYASKRQGLRVTHPHGAQNGAYFLSLPWSFSIPLLIFSMALHWFVSQSIFLAYINGFDYAVGGAEPVPLGAVVVGLGWSPLALILSLILGGFLIIALWIMGVAFRYGKRMPLARDDTAAISAACHPPVWDKDAATRPLMYGVVGEEEGPIRHVSFSSGRVIQLLAGETYI